MIVRAVLCACVLAGASVLHAQEYDVQVETMRLLYDTHYVITVNNTIEYILEFTQNNPSLAVAAPARVLLSSDTAQSQHPILVAARQNNDVETTDRTILHVTTTCSISVTLTVRVEAVRDFYVSLDNEVTLSVAPSSPRYYFFSHEPGTLVSRLGLETMRARWKSSCSIGLDEDEKRRLIEYEKAERTVVIPPRVQLVMESDDDLCAIVSIQNYSCPVFDNEREILYEGQYLTMMRSGSISIDRSTYPDGFYVVFIVKSSDEDCVGPATGSSETIETILLNAVLGEDGSEHRNDDGTAERRKVFRFRLEPSITYMQYLVATVVAVVFYVGFYLLFVTSMFVFRLKYLRRFVQSSYTPHSGPGSDVEGTDDTYIVNHAGNSSGVARSGHSHGDVYRITVSSDVIDGGQAAAALNERRNSNTTFDGSDLSDSDEEEDAPRARTQQVDGAGNGSRHPFGLPAQLRLAALAQHRVRVLRARSDRYLWTVLTVAVFYSLPVVQLVATYQRTLNHQGEQDLCYYNFLCAHPLGVLSDFNHVVSNLGYALLGLLFIIQVARRQHRHKDRADDQEYGIPEHHGLFYAMGVALVVEALLSGSYHVCPNQMNFQFDMAFMYVMAVLCMVKIYQSRHPDINARAHATFGVLAIMIALCVWGVLSNSTFFWTLFTVLHLSTFLLMSLQIYYVGKFTLKGKTVARAARELAAAPVQAVRPLYTTQLVALFIANCANWMLAGWGLWNESTDFASHLLYILLGNTVLYTFFYITMKLLHGERIKWHAWCFIWGAAVTWAPAMYYFVNGSTSWATTPALSRHFNKPCYLLNFFDSHDIWHFLSAIAMFLSFNMLLTWDDGLSGTPRSKIDVF